MAIGFSPKLPLRYDSVDGYYRMNKTVGEVAKQNIKMVVMTSPGERIMNPDFGVGLRNFLFEPENFEFERLRTTIYKQVKKYVPFVSIQKINTVDLQDIPGEQSPTNSLGIQIIYTIPSAGLSDSLTVTFKD
jgi:phage baseplate assembly protein W